jgi:galactokinase
MAQAINGGAYDGAFAYLYARRPIPECRERYIGLIDLFIDSYAGGSDIIQAAPDAGINSETAAPIIVSAPGRTEICGNHTDHQHGNVLAAAIDLDIICVAAFNNSGRIRVKSTGHPGMIDVDINDTDAREDEKGDASALIRGLSDWFKGHGARLCGFDAYTTSHVLVGSGLSSSAAFEVAIGTAMNTLFKTGFSPLQIAIAGQYAENNFFGKPCGLMDQTASSVGGFVRIDFADPPNPVVEPIAYDLKANGLCLCVVDTKGSHENLTGDYAAIPEEMKAVASFFGKRFLRETDENVFYEKLADIRNWLHKGGSDGRGLKPTVKIAADRALLRAIHFFNENRLVDETAQALRDSDTARFLDGVIRSGRSSFTCLENIFSVAQPGEQGLAIALALSESVLRGGGGAWRVHGGGFAGTIMAFVPEPLLEIYRKTLEAVFGEGSCLTLSIRAAGGIEVTGGLK